MSINKTYIDSQLKLLPGEQVLLNYKGVEFSIEGKKLPKEFHGNHKGIGYLSSTRIIFATSKKANYSLKSIAMPFNCLRDVELKQPVFGSNYIRGTVVPELGETAFEGPADFKMYFTSGGAIELATMYLRLVRAGGTVAPPHPSAVAPAVMAQAVHMQYEGGPYSSYPTQPGGPAPPSGAYPPPPNAAYSSNTGTAYYSQSNPGQVYTPMEGLPQNPPPYTEVEKKND